MTRLDPPPLLGTDPRAVLPAHISIRHLQLRDLVHCTADNKILYVYDKAVHQHRPDVGNEKPSRLAPLRFPPVTMTTDYGLVAAGGQSSELALHSLDEPEAKPYFTSLHASINNSLHFCRDPLSSVEPRLLVCNNDQSIRVFRVARRAKGGTPALENVDVLRFPTAINHASVSPTSRILVAAGDTPEVHLFDCSPSGSFRRIHTLSVATDAGFSTAWSADGMKFAVASQDGMCAVWDVRSSKPLAQFHTLDGHMAARCVKFSPPGSHKELMIFTEHRNRIHVVDATTFSLSTCQTLRVPLASSRTPPSLTPTRFPSPSLSQPPHSHGYSDTPRPPHHADVLAPLFPHSDNAALRQLFTVSFADVNRPPPGEANISGACFSQDGSRVYAGTEENVVEWEVLGAALRMMDEGQVA